MISKRHTPFKSFALLIPEYFTLCFHLTQLKRPSLFFPPRENIIPVKKTFPAFCSFPLTLKAVIYFRCTVLVSIMSKICKTFVENKTSILKELNSFLIGKFMLTLPIIRMNLSYVCLDFLVGPRTKLIWLKMYTVFWTLVRQTGRIMGKLGAIHEAIIWQDTQKKS